MMFFRLSIIIDSAITRQYLQFMKKIGLHSLAFPSRCGLQLLLEIGTRYRALFPFSWLGVAFPKMCTFSSVSVSSVSVSSASVSAFSVFFHSVFLCHSGCAADLVFVLSFLVVTLSASVSVSTSVSVSVCLCLCLCLCLCFCLCLSVDAVAFCRFFFSEDVVEELLTFVSVLFFFFRGLCSSSLTSSSSFELISPSSWLAFSSFKLSSSSRFYPKNQNKIRSGSFSNKFVKLRGGEGTDRKKTIIPRFGILFEPLPITSVSLHLNSIS